MAEHPNAARVRDAVDAFNRRDLDAILAGWTDDPIFHHGGNSALTGTYRGIEEFREFLSRDLTGWSMHLEPIDLLADDKHGTVLFEATGDGPNGPVATTVAYAVRFDDEGKQAEGWMLASDQAAWDRFYSTND